MSVFTPETVTVLTPALSVDPYSGENRPDWSLPPATTTEVVTLAPPEPRPGSEPLLVDARDASSEGWTLYLPAGVPVTAWNRVVVRGITYPVQGNPSEWGTTGLVVQVYRVEG